MRPRETIVKVMRGLSSFGNPMPATIYKKGGAHTETQFLSPEQTAEIGDALSAYYTAERIGGRWSLKEKLPDIPTRTW